MALREGLRGKHLTLRAEKLDRDAIGILHCNCPAVGNVFDGAMRDADSIHVLGPIANLGFTRAAKPDDEPTRPLHTPAPPGEGLACSHAQAFAVTSIETQSQTTSVLSQKIPCLNGFSTSSTRTPEDHSGRKGRGPASWR